MSLQPINKEITRTATETINCNASDWVKMFLNQSTFNRMTDKEKTSIKAMQMRKGSIIKGMRYTEEHGVHRDKAYISNYVQEIHEICLKYKIYSYTQKNKQKVIFN